MLDLQDVVNNIGRDLAAAVQLVEDTHRRIRTVAVSPDVHIVVVKIGTLMLPVATRNLFGL